MDSPQKRVITRNRGRLACEDCRRRKLRCDRSLPCGSCVRRGVAASCTYESLQRGSDNERDRRIQAESRLERLEQLVHQLAAQPGHPSAEPDPAADSDAQVGKVSDARPDASESLTYNGTTHWSAMLEDIEALRCIVAADGSSSEEDDVSEQRGDFGTGLIFGAPAPTPARLSLDDVLARYLPNRKEADRLMSAYFRGGTVAAPFVHAAQFRRQYQVFWADPSSTPPLWISIFFSVCHIASRTLAHVAEKEGADNRYAIAAAHCLALGEYFRPQRFAVEALLLYAQSLCLTSLTLPPDIGSIFGLLARLVTSMGYHRDPDMFRLSPFESEMRRRAWSLFMQLDLLISFHLGLPSATQFPTWDTRAPRNLLDSDFGEDSAELPPPRPDAEPTSILFYITKHKFMVVFERILRHVLDTRANTAGGSGVDELDADIRGVYAALPDVLRPRPMSESIVDQPSVIVTRLCVSFLYQKCLCVLHRPYVTRHQQESVVVCYAAASGLVRDFLDAHEEFLPGGQAASEQWFMSSITWHDFLLGLMTLCLVLCANTRSSAGEIDSVATLTLLERARTVCAEQAPRRHKDTVKLLSLVDATILHFGSRDTVQAPRSEIGLEASQMQGIQPPPANDGWAGDETLPVTETNSDWEFLQQFLDLSNTPALEAWQSAG